MDNNPHLSENDLDAICEILRYMHEFSLRDDVTLSEVRGLQVEVGERVSRFWRRVLKDQVLS